MRKKCHNYTPEEKVFILRRHLVEHTKGSVSPYARVINGTETHKT